MIVDGGAIRIDSADDAIHSNGSVVINGGAFSISTGDDAMHADSSLEINGGEIRIVESYEGLESAAIAINDGIIDIVSSDDGLNVAGGNDGSGMMAGPGRGGGMGQGWMPGQDAFASSGSYHLDISGGTVTIDAAGDGIDVNGSIAMTAGTVLINGPTEDMNGALDYDAGFQITGGLLVAAGSSGMAQAPDQSSTQYSVLLDFGSTIQAGTLLHIQSSDGEQVLTYAPAKQYETVVLSSPELKAASYDVYLGGRSTGAVTDGLYDEGTISSNTDAGSFTISGIVTWVGRGYR